MNALDVTLLYLLAAVLGVVACRYLRLPPILGYLLVGVGQPIQLDYRMEKTDAGWLIYDINVLGLWLVETYRTQFAAVAGSDSDVKALLDALKALNRANTPKS